jgi:hypothetical protein
MPYIGKEPIVGNFQVCDAITVVNGQAAYTLQVSSTNVVPESSHHMLVSLNGILQKNGGTSPSFTVSGSTLTFASNLATGDVIDFVILLGNVLDLGVPSDDTVGAAQIKADLISGTTALASEPADTDEFLVSDAGTLKRIDYSLIKGGGKVLQCLQAVKTNTFSYASNTYGDLTGITLDITPSATTSKILVMTQLSMAVDNGGQPALKLLRDSTALNMGAAASSRTQATTTFFTEATWENTPVSIIYLDSPSSTSALTYKVQGYATGGNTIYVNQSGADTDTAAYYRSGSSIVLMEIGA